LQAQLPVVKSYSGKTCWFHIQKSFLFCVARVVIAMEAEALPPAEPALVQQSSTDSNASDSAAQARALRRAKILARGENRLNLLKGTAEKIEAVDQEQLKSSAAVLLAKEQEERAAAAAAEAAEKEKQSAKAEAPVSSQAKEEGSLHEAPPSGTAAGAAGGDAARSSRDDHQPATTTFSSSTDAPKPAVASSTSSATSLPKVKPAPRATLSWKRHIPSTGAVIRAMISLLPVILGIWMAHAWHRCGGFESVPMRLAAMERAALAIGDSSSSRAATSNSAASSLLKMKMAAKIDSDVFAGSSGDEFSSSTAGVASASSSSNDDGQLQVNLRDIGGVLCQAGDRGWLPVVIVLLFGLRFLMEKHTKFLVGGAAPAASVAPSRPSTVPSPCPPAAGGPGMPPVDPNNPMAMIQQMMMGGPGAGAGAAGGLDGNPLSSLASKAGAAMDAWRLVKAFAFDWLLFTVVFIASGAVMEWLYLI
jgi:hypothetical protein